MLVCLILLRHSIVNMYLTNKYETRVTGDEQQSNPVHVLEKGTVYMKNNMEIKLRK